jgi:hypothetical protein
MIKRHLFICTMLMQTLAIAQSPDLKLENEITKIARERCSSELIEGKDYTIEALANGDVSVRFIGKKGGGIDGSFVYKKSEWSGKRKVSETDQLEKDKIFQRCVADQTSELSKRYIPDQPKKKISVTFPAPQDSGRDVLLIVPPTGTSTQLTQIAAATESAFASSRQFDVYNTADYQLTDFLNDFSSLRSAGANYLLTYTLASSTTHTSATLRLINLRTGQPVRTATVNSSPTDRELVTDLARKIWRAAEGGHYPEASIWQDGLGYCARLVSVAQNLQKYRCTDVDSQLSYNEAAQQTGAVRDCSSLWKRSGALATESSCQLTCRRKGSRPEQAALYFRGNAARDSGSRRIGQRTRDQVETLFGSNALQARRPDYLDSSTFFEVLHRDIASCLVDKNGWIEGGGGRGSTDAVAKHVYLTRDGQIAVELQHVESKLGEVGREYIQHFYAVQFIDPLR